MCSVNLVVRIIFVILLTIITFFIDNYYLFWLLLFYMLLIAIVDRNYKGLLIIFAISMILLFTYYTKKIRIILKVLFIINIVYSFFFSLSKKEKKYLRIKYFYRNKYYRKKMLLKSVEERVNKENLHAVSQTYKKDLDVSDKVKSDLNDLYLLGKIRFYGYGNKITNFSNKGFTGYDLIFLVVLLSFTIFVILY